MHLEEKVQANVRAFNQQKLQCQQKHRPTQIHVLFQRSTLHDEGAIVLRFDGQLAGTFHSFVFEDGAKTEDQHKEATLNCLVPLNLNMPIFTPYTRIWAIE